MYEQSDGTLLETVGKTFCILQQTRKSYLYHVAALDAVIVCDFEAT